MIFFSFPIRRLRPLATAEVASWRSRRGRAAASGILAAAITLAACVIPGAAQAQDAPKVLGTYKAWTAYQSQENGETLCFIVSDPTEKRLSRVGRNRGDVHFLLSHWPGKDIYGQPSVIIGYPFARNSSPSVRIGSDQFELVLDPENQEIYEERAWAPDEQTEKRLIEAMRRGTTMVVTGRSASGTVSTDTYSLLGFTAAMERIGKQCK